MEPDHPDLGIPGLTDARVLGRGGFGTVYAVREPEFGRTVAVKVLRERLDDDTVRRAFQRECQAMGSLSGHPHIVTVHRGGTSADGRPYIVMDLMPGGSLADKVAARSGVAAPMSWPEVLDVAVLMAGALETAHRHGVLHLDLKPANILVSRYGEPKLGDFGIARLPGITETSGQIRVSPAYAAPERMADGASTVRTDLYGLGATVYTLLTGAPAFSTGSDEYLVLLARVAREPLPDLRPRGVPDAVCRVVERLMAKAPDDRYARASDVALACQEAQRTTGRPVTRPVIDGAPTAVDEAGAPTDLAVHPPLPAQSPLPAHSTQLPPPRPTIAVAAPVPWPAQGHSPAWAPKQPPPRPLAVPAKRPAGGRGALLAVAAAILVAALAVTGWALLPRSGGSATPVGNGVPVTTTEAPVPPSGSAVAVAAGVTHPQTENARATLQSYVDAINEARYVDAFALFTDDSPTVEGTLEGWLDQQQPREISVPVITDVRDAAADTLEVGLTFTTRQAAEYGPADSGQTCTDWHLTYELVGPAPDWLIRTAQLREPFEAC